MTQHHETTAGTIIGGSLGFVKAFYMNLHAMVLLDISWSVVGETSLLSGVGAFIGLIVSYYGKMLLKKIHKT